MSNPTVVERMARAIYEGYGLKKTKHPEMWMNMAKRQALAALEALRVPSEGMLLAVGMTLDGDGPVGSEVWAAGIDAAISEHKGK